MEFFKTTHVDFMGVRKRLYVFSCAVILTGIVSMFAHGGLKLGVDFAGGTLIQLRFDRSVTVEEVRASLATKGHGGAEIQESHDQDASARPDILVRAGRGGEGANAAEEVIAALRATFGDAFQIRRQETVGPKIGGELRRAALWAILAALGGLLVYISWRFDFRSGVAAIIALFHDVLATVGFISLTDREVTLTVLAALLTLVGYSINDTIVVFDRVREDLRLYPRTPYTPLVNTAVNRTLGRTIITGGTTLVVCFLLYFLGGEVLHDFAFVMTVGMLFGTYSSIFVASAIAVDWEVRSPHFRPPAEEPAGASPAGGSGRSPRKEKREKIGAGA